MRTLFYSLLAAISIAGIVAVVDSQSTSALSLTMSNGVNAAHGEGMPTQIFGDSGTLTYVINAMLFAVGFLSVIMIIWGGLRYVISGGNSTSVTAAKNTILYAIVGLIIALFSYAVINFVFGSLTGGGTSGTNV